jgi:hypothetical protein
VNVDGEPDLVVTDYDGNFVDVLLGLGGNSFELVEPCSTCANVPASVGVHPLSVAIADVNGDGKPDLATANSGSGNVSILLGNGDGTFQAQLEFSTGSQSAPSSVVIEDLNGDGKPDLATANNGSNNVSILLGNGDGTFQAQVSYGAGTGPYSIGIADLNGDGKPDLAVANNGSNTASVLPGNGDGSFQPQLVYDTGSSPTSIAIGDLNDDGRPDLAIADNGSNDVTVVISGDTFGPATYAAASDPFAIAIADFNGDGKPDLAVTLQGNAAVGVLLETCESASDDAGAPGSGGVTSILVIPGSTCLPPSGGSIQFSAEGQASHGGVFGLTADVDWQSTDQGSLLTFSTSTPGLATTVSGASGSTTVLALEDGAFGSATLNLGCGSSEVCCWTGQIGPTCSSSCQPGSQVCNVASDCSSGTACNSGVCSCPGASQLCGNACVTIRDMLTDVNNCGACGVSCAPVGTSCSGGACVCASTTTVTNLIIATPSTDLVPLGGTLQLSATATLNGTPGVNVTQLVQWEATPTNVAGVTGGTVSGLSPGSATISGSLCGTTATSGETTNAGPAPVTVYVPCSTGTDPTSLANADADPTTGQCTGGNSCCVLYSSSTLSIGCGSNYCANVGLGASDPSLVCTEEGTTCPSGTGCIVAENLCNCSLRYLPSGNAAQSVSVCDPAGAAGSGGSVPPTGGTTPPSNSTPPSPGVPGSTSSGGNSSSSTSGPGSTTGTGSGGPPSNQGGNTGGSGPTGSGNIGGSNNAAGPTGNNNTGSSSTSDASPDDAGADNAGPGAASSDDSGLAGTSTGGTNGGGAGGTGTGTGGTGTGGGGP